MTRRHIQPKRWTIQWSQNIRELVGQLHRFERLTYDSLSTIATEIIQQVDSVDGLNLGSGARVFVERLGNYLRFRTLRASTGMTVAENGNHIDFACTVAPDPLSFDLIWRGDDDPPGDQGGSVVNGRLLISAETVDAGNQAAALVARMAHGGVVRWMRKTSVTEALEVHVGPPTNEVDYLSFPIFDQFSTFVSGDLGNLQYATDHYVQWDAQTDRNVHIDPTGRHMLRCAGGGIYQYYLHTPHAVKTAALVHMEVVSGTDADPRAAVWASDGDYVIWLGGAANTIFRFDCGAAYAMAGGSDSGTSRTTGLSDTRGLARSNDGLHLLVSTVTSNVIARFDGSVADDLTTFSGTPSETVTTTSALSNVTASTQISLSPDEQTLYLRATNSSQQVVIAIALLAPYTLTGMAENSRTPDLAALAASINGHHVSPDGQYLYIIDDTNNRVYRMNIHALTEDVTYRVAFVPIALGTATCATDFEDASTVDFVEFNVPVYGLRKDVAVNCTPRTGLTQTAHAVYGHSAFVRDDDELCIRVVGSGTLLCGAHRLIWDVEQHGSYLTPSIHETPTSSPIIGPTAPATFLNDTGVIVASAGDVDFDLSSWGLQSGDDLFMHVFSDSNLSLIENISDQGWVDVIQFATGGFRDHHLFYKRWGEDGQTDDDIFTLTEVGPTDWAAAIVAFRGAGGVRSGIIGRGVRPYLGAFRKYQDTNTSLSIPAAESMVYLPQWPGAINLAFVHTTGTASLGAPSGGTEIYNAAVGTHGRMACVQLNRGVSATMTIGASQPWVTYIVGVKPARLT